MSRDSIENMLLERKPLYKQFSLRLFLLLLCIGMAAPFTYAAFSKVYAHYVEISPPEIELLEVPRGLGLAPTQLRFRLRDSDAGLDEVIVRARQRGRVREILKTKLKGVPLSEQLVPFEDSKSNFQEGVVEFEIVAFDRAFWSNRGEKSFQLRVDFHRPKVEVVTTQHNARRGGAQLVFYRAFDEEVSISGVKVGERKFQGFRARGLDPAFEDSNLYVAFYALDLDYDAARSPITLFVEDMVGNEATADFYNKVLERPRRQVSVVVTDEVLQSSVSALFDQSALKIGEYAGAVDGNPQAAESDPLVRKFKLLLKVLKPVNQADVAKQLEQSPRFESFLKQFFLRQGGATRVQFGDQINYVYGEQLLGSEISRGTEFSLPQGQRDVLAVNDGIVARAESVGVYGRIVVLDHGLGVASLYAHLGEIKVRKGEQVARGEVLGTTGISGLSIRPGVFIEMRVHGVPVDPLEWWDASWFNQHVVGKIDDMKRLFGLLTTQPLKLGAGL